MAFDGSRLGAQVDSIGGGLVRIFGYNTLDELDVLLATDYVVDAEKFGLRVGDIFVARATDGTLFLVSVAAISAAGHGTLEIIDDNNINTLKLATDIAGFRHAAGTDWLETRGHTVFGSGAGLYQEVATPTAAMPAIFRKTDFNGNLYEAVVRNTLDAGLAGVVADGVTDDGPAITEALRWLGVRGGGRLMLPAKPDGAIRCNTPPEMLASGIVLEGHAPGDSSNAGGTILYLTDPGAEAKFLIGNDSATQTQTVAIRNMRVLATAGKGYAFQTRNVRDVRFQNITVQCQTGGFLAVGTPTRSSYIVFMDTIEASVLGDVGGDADYSHGLLLLNCAGYLNITNSGFEASYITGSAGILVPTYAYDRPDGMQIINSSFGKFGRGLEVKGGGANWTIASTIFDDIAEIGIFISPNNAFNNFKLLGSHINGRYTGGDGTYGVVLGVDVGGTSSGIQIDGNNIFNWATSGLIYVGAATTDVLIANNVFTDCTNGADNTSPAVLIQVSGDVAYSVSNNVITGGANRPIYGINHDSTSTAAHTVTGNVINAWGTAPINNPNRLSPNLKKVFGNSGNVAAGTTSAYGPWFATDVVDATDAPMIRLTGNTASVIAPRQGWIIGVSGESNAAIVAGTIELFVAVNTNIAGGTIIATLTSAAQKARQTNEDGIPFVEGDSLSVRYNCATINPAGSLDISADILVYWD